MITVVHFFVCVMLDPKCEKSKVTSTRIHKSSKCVNMQLLWHWMRSANCAIHSCCPLDLARQLVTCKLSSNRFIAFLYNRLLFYLKFVCFDAIKAFKQIVRRIY